MHISLVFDDESIVTGIKIMHDNDENPDNLHKATYNLLLENTAKTFAEQHKNGEHEDIPKIAVYRKARIANALSQIFVDSRQTSDPKSELNICQAFVNLCNLYIKVLGLNRCYYPSEDECYFNEEITDL